jgi:hypothetical protein
MKEIAKHTHDAMVIATSYPPDQNPAVVYLMSLPSKASRRTMRWTLDTAADLVRDGQLTCEELPWGQMRYQHVASLRGWLLATTQ